MRSCLSPRILILSTATVLACAINHTEAASTEEPPLEWHHVATWGVEGRAWPDLERLRWFDRLPASAQGKVTEKVWELSRDGTGMMVRFATDASTIWAEYALREERLNGWNMAPVAASGLDLYARDDNGEWRWAGVSRPLDQKVRGSLLDGIAPGFREYAIYLPLWNGIENLSIGVPPNAKFEKLPPRAERPIVFYGTSITHGASASRPGMVHTAILGRRFDKPVINLGFSGNGRMDKEVGDYLVLIDAAVFVIDCLPNMNPTTVREKCIPLVNQLRKAQPDTPIVLVEDRRKTNSWIRPSQDAFHNANHEALRECFDALQASGVSGLYYIPGDDLLGDDSEGTADSSHPNDLGFMRQADVFEPVLRAALTDANALDS